MRRVFAAIAVLSVLTVLAVAADQTKAGKPGAGATRTRAVKPDRAAKADTAAPEAAQPKPAGQDKPILSTLRSGHPRIIALEADAQRVRELAKTDPEVARMCRELRRDAEKILNQPPVVHELIGPRLLHQSRLCSDRVYLLASVCRIENDMRFAQRAEKEMLAAAAFPDWNPKHFLDTAEMTHALGIGYDWLYDVLSPESRRIIKTAIVEKGLKPAEKIYRENGWWARGTNNWNQVCNGGITVGALAVADEEPQLAEYILGRARESIRIPTARLAPDGGWDEGPGYWNYAMSFTAYYLAAVQTALGTDFGLHESPGMAETGLFRINCVGPTGLVFNFADGSPRVGHTPEMLLFAKLYNRPVYAAYERQIRGTPPIELWWYDPRGSKDDIANLPLSTMFKNIDVAFIRSAWNDPKAMFVGFKGGDNKASHGHLDLGTFVLDGLGQRWAIDLGGDEYNMPGYFGKQRWTYYRLRTEGHNTLLINGENQDTKAAAKIIAFKPQPGVAFAVADLTEAYKAAKRVTRGVAMLDPKHLLIQDEIQTDRPLSLEWAMHTNADVQKRGDTLELAQMGEKMLFKATSSIRGTWGVREVKLDPPQRPAEDTRRVAYAVKVAPPGVRIQMLIGPDEQVTVPTIGVDDWPKGLK